MTQYQASTLGPLVVKLVYRVLQYLVYSIITSFILAKLLSVVKGRVCVKILSI